MATILHLIDSRTPPAAAGLLELIRHRRPQDVLANVGPLNREDFPAAAAEIRRPWSRAAAAKAIRQFAQERGAGVLHCWTAELAELLPAIGLPACAAVLAPPAAERYEAMRVAGTCGTLFITPSEFLRQVLLQGGINAAAIVVVPPAAEPASAAGDAGRARPQAGRRVLIAPAQHDDDRGPYWAVWALGLLMQIDDVAELLILGDGPAARRAENLARENSMLDRVHRLCGRAAAAAWARADAAVLYDGQGIGLAGTAQAVAAGVPIIAAAGGELAATLTHDRTALLAAPGKALMLARALWRLVRDADLGPRLARQARTELEPLTDVQAWLGAMESVYRRLGA